MDITTCFYFALNMSISASVIISLLALIRLFVPKRAAYWLWAAAFFRLLLPFSVSSRFSLFNFTGGLIKKVIYFAEDSAYTGELSILNSVGAANSLFPVKFSETPVTTLFETAGIVWLSGTLAALVFLIMLYFLTLRAFGTAVRQPYSGRLSIYSSEAVISPVLVGLFRTRLIVPQGLDLDSQTGRLIVVHELVHLRRKDNLRKIIALATGCIHWFNPFSWIMIKLFFTDMELSCDDEVLKSCNTEEQKHYAEALLFFAEKKRDFPVSAFGRSLVYARIENSLSYKKLTSLGFAASLVFFAVVLIIFVTNPA